jgi:anti-sigma B factor antagonist
MVQHSITLVFEGELETHNWEEFRATIIDAAGNGITAVVLDLGNVTFIDSSGVRALLGARELEPRGVTIHLGACSTFVQRLVEVTGIGEYFRRYRRCDPPNVSAPRPSPATLQVRASRLSASCGPGEPRRRSTVLAHCNRAEALAQRRRIRNEGLGLEVKLPRVSTTKRTAHRPSRPAAAGRTPRAARGNLRTDTRGVPTNGPSGAAASHVSEPGNA